MLVYFLGYSLQFYIKHFYDDLYIGGDIYANDRTQVAPEGINFRGDYMYELGYSGLIIKPKFGKKIWDIRDNYSLIYFKEHGGPNQVFQIEYIGPYTYQIINRGKCLEYKPYKREYETTFCNRMARNQKFAFIKTEEEEIYRTYG
ncbi:hypothetical protein NCER_100579 [Vairimorpha ceranae BRL01]|uniref:Uncharacterized protein n=1 Tax=Vairimorpha ceranae (strain BRL01) TaxID=578460 RepID=C4V7Y3_VAIC1|nr:hypothetical protein NCER_100579 [Vairimorpha ceranae BRL01]